MSGSGTSATALHSHQYAMSMLQTNPQKVPKTPHLTGLHNTNEKKSAKHLYMSLTHDRGGKISGVGNVREKAHSQERIQKGGNKQSSKNQSNA